MAKKPDMTAKYTITVGGTYGAFTQDGKEGYVEKPYELTVVMTEKMFWGKQKQKVLEADPKHAGHVIEVEKEVDAQVHGPVSIFKHYFKDHLTRKYPDFQVFKTHEIVGRTTRTDGKPVNNVNVMNRQQMVEYVEEHELPVTTSMYEDSGTLRTAIKKCEEDEPSFLRSQDQMMRHRKPGIDVVSEILAENPLEVSDEEKPRPKGGRPRKQTEEPQESPTVGAGI